MTPVTLRADAKRLHHIADHAGVREANEMRRAADSLDAVAEFLDKLAFVAREHWREPTKAEKMGGRDPENGGIDA